jgi:hypothetical protein
MMSGSLSRLTIGELFSQLAEVEEAIRVCEPVFTRSGDAVAVADQLVSLAEREQSIAAELARRRAELRSEWQQPEPAAVVM